MKSSLRRTLALRFAATMAVGLLLATAAFYWAATRALRDALSTAALERDLVLVLLAIVLTGTAATLMGAWQFTSSAVRPVAEITAQATRIEAGTLNQRIMAHAETEEYEGLVAVLNRMLERLERGFAAQRRLTADVSHELRTPREYQLVLRSALEEIERLSTMSEDLLLITRADARLLALHRTPTSVPDLVNESLDHLHQRIEEKDIIVERVMHGGERASVDPELASRVVDHLLENAVAHTPPGGHIDVSVENGAGDGVRLTVTNSGPAIAAEDLEHLFEPFYRADPSRTRANDEGTGLGLAMVAAIARLHDGTARVSADAKEGARFEVELGGLAHG